MPLVPLIERPLNPILLLLADDGRPLRLEDVGGTLEEQHAEDVLLELGRAYPTYPSSGQRTQRNARLLTCVHR